MPNKCPFSPKRDQFKSAELLFFYFIFLKMEICWSPEAVGSQCEAPWLLATVLHGWMSVMRPAGWRTRYFCCAFSCISFELFVWESWSLLSHWVPLVAVMRHETAGGCNPPLSAGHCSGDVCRSGGLKGHSMYSFCGPPTWFSQFLGKELLMYAVQTFYPALGESDTCCYSTVKLMLAGAFQESLCISWIWLIHSPWL